MSRKQQSGTYVGVFIMGMVSTLIVSPCVTAPLVGVLMYIGQTGDIILGASALFAMGIGMGIPLLIIGMSARRALPKSGPWMDLVKKFFGLIMFGMAIWIFSRISSMTVKFEAVAVLLLGAGLFIGVMLPRYIGWRKLNRGIGFAAGMAGVLLMVSVAIMPKSNGTGNLADSLNTGHSFIVVHNLAELNQQLMLAQTEHKPAILDFYADWCESCVLMDKNVFSMPDVKHALDNFILLRADLSENNEADDVMLKNFAVVAPPTVIFFNNVGKEVNSRRIIGELNAQEFVGRINTFMSASCDKKIQC